MHCVYSSVPYHCHRKGKLNLSFILCHLDNFRCTRSHSSWGFLPALPCSDLPCPLPCPTLHCPSLPSLALPYSTVLYSLLYQLLFFLQIVKFMNNNLDFLSSKSVLRTRGASTAGETDVSKTHLLVSCCIKPVSMVTIHICLKVLVL